MANSYDEYDQPHHPECPAHPDNIPLDNTKVVIDCGCEDLYAADYERAVDRAVDAARDK